MQDFQGSDSTETDAEGTHGHTHHENHHRLIAERVDLWRSTPLNGRAKFARREALKAAHATIVGHLRCCHGWRGNSFHLGIDDLLAIHEVTS